MYPMAMRDVQTSCKAAHRGRGEKARRRSGGNVSGCRIAHHRQAGRAVAINTAKVARHPLFAITTSPRAGAMQGTRMNTAMTTDMIRAISRPA